MKVVKKTDFRDLESEQTMGKKEEYLTQFLYEFFFIDNILSSSTDSSSNSFPKFPKN